MVAMILWRATIPKTVRIARFGRWGVAALGILLSLGVERGLAQATGIPAPGTPGTGAAGAAGGAPLAVPQAAGQVTPGAEGARGPGAQGGGSGSEEAVPLTTTVWQWRGLTVDAIRFEGVSFEATDALPAQLAQKAGTPLDPDAVRQSMRRLYASGRYDDITVRGVRTGDNVTLIFAGQPKYFVGRVEIAGVKDERIASLLEYGTRLDPGTVMAEDAIPTSVEGIKTVLATQGYYEPKVMVTTSRDDRNEQINATYTVNVGPQARVGKVVVEGKDPGISVEEFRKRGGLTTRILKHSPKVSHDTTSDALTKLRTYFQKKDRLEASVTLLKQTYDQPKRALDYDFHVEQGPVVKVTAEGVRLSKSKLHLLVPVYEEGTIDNDLLNEGAHNIKEYLQEQGYFDAAVTQRVIGEDTPSEHVVFSVDKGTKHKVYSVDLKGNKYFDTDTLKERMRVQKADAYLRSGRYSTSLMTADLDSIISLYRANGFNLAKATPEVRDVDKTVMGEPLKVAQLRVVVTIDEGPQQKFGPVTLAGVGVGREGAVKALLNAQQGQPFSLITLSGDRDAVLGYYVSNGFDQARVEIKQLPEQTDKTVTDVTLNVTEGPQVFINHVLLSGIRRTKPAVVENQLKVHEADPLDQSALLETQRNLYSLALFNEVNAAVQNPTGDTPRKNVLVQVTEARRWDVTYGFGFEAQTGTPNAGKISEASRRLLNLPPNAQFKQNGKVGVSPRVSADVTRIGLRGTDESLTLHTTYGLLEKVATLSFQNPHLLGNKNFSAAISGGYSNVQNISTFAASTLQGDFRVTQRARRTDTFIYDFQYRRVAVDPNSLQVSANLIPLLSQPVRVGGPGVTWFHDKRSPSPLDAVKGSYTTVQEFLASSKFGSQTDFNRLDATNSTYKSFGKNRRRQYVFARNTRFGIEKTFGRNPNISVQECAGKLLDTNASCDQVPLPERLYAGGATSHRGFGINGAGPRDLQTGFPVGGRAALVNTLELRLPAPTLPYVGDSVNFVVFHDMGNVFQNPKDLLPSIGRFSQPNQETCKDVSSLRVRLSKVGTCDFNYFSHAIGLGARYKTPVGPIRADFSYNLNPPIYPVIFDFNNSNPHVGMAPHFNFFFSIGQSF